MDIGLWSVVKKARSSGLDSRKYEPRGGAASGGLKHPVLPGEWDSQRGASGNGRQRTQYRGPRGRDKFLRFPYLGPKDHALVALVCDDVTG